MHPLSQVQEKAGWHPVRGGRRQRCHRLWLSSGVSCGLGVLDQLADSWRKSLLESLVCDSGKTSGNMELCRVAPIRQDSLRDGGEGVARQNLVPLPALLSVAGGQGLLGTRTEPIRAGQSLRWMVSPEGHLGPLPRLHTDLAPALRAPSPLQLNHKPGIFKSVLRFTQS